MPNGRFAADIAAWVAKVKGAEKLYLGAFAVRLLDRIIPLTAIDTSWMRNHWRASLDGSTEPLEPRPPRAQVPFIKDGADSKFACYPVFLAWNPGQKLLVYNNAVSEEGTEYYPLLTEYGGPKNPAHFTLTQITAMVPEIAAEALAAVRAQNP